MVSTVNEERKIMFSLDPKELEKRKEWEENHNLTCPYTSYSGAIGGRLTFSFTPTSLGVIAKIKCACGEETDLTDYDLW